MKMIKVFGKHLTVDMYGADEKLLSDSKGVFRFLNILPKKIGMRKLADPCVVVCKSEKYKESGIAAFVLLYESHISCHTWPEYRYVSIDVYSCRDFNEEKTMRYIKKFWKGERVKVKVSERG